MGLAYNKSLKILCDEITYNRCKNSDVSFNTNFDSQTVKGKSDKINIFQPLREINKTTNDNSNDSLSGNSPPPMSPRGVTTPTRNIFRKRAATYRHRSLISPNTDSNSDSIPNLTLGANDVIGREQVIEELMKNKQIFLKQRTLESKVLLIEAERGMVKKKLLIFYFFYFIIFLKK